MPFTVEPETDLLDVCLGVVVLRCNVVNMVDVEEAVVGVLAGTVTGTVVVGVNVEVEVVDVVVGVVDVVVGVVGVVVGVVGVVVEVVDLMVGLVPGVGMSCLAVVGARVGGGGVASVVDLMVVEVDVEASFL